MNFNIIIIILLLLVNCSYKKENILLRKIKWQNLDNWNDDNHLDALKSFGNSCNIFDKMQKDKYIINRFKQSGTAGDWQNICKSLDDKYINNDNLARSFFEENFIPYLVTYNNNKKGLFTGYYEIDLYGSYKKSDRYAYPIYQKPENIDRIKNYLEHKHINNGFLAGRGLELLYVDNDVDLFFLHIQGSGRIILDNGDIIRVGYSAQNGYPYYSIGRYFINNLDIDKSVISADYIRNFLNNYNFKREIMELNQSYIFFKKNNNIAAIGSSGSILTKERSIAIDQKFIPIGIPIWIDTTYPKTDFSNKEEKFRKLLIAQDTGGAIKGAIRGDIFFGNGIEARKYSSNMKQEGIYYLLLPKKYDR